MECGGQTPLFRDAGPLSPVGARDCRARLTQIPRNNLPIAAIPQAGGVHVGASHILTVQSANLVWPLFGPKQVNRRQRPRFLSNSRSCAEKWLYRPESISRSRAYGGISRNARIAFSNSGRGALAELVSR